MTQQPTASAPPQAPQADRADQNLSDGLASVANEIGRTDNKASLLLAFNGAVIAGLAATINTPLPPLTRTAGALAALTLAASAVLLLQVVRPRLAYRSRTGFLHWARCTPADIRAEIGTDHRAEHLQVLSVIALRKFRGLRHAVDLSLFSVVLLVIAVLAPLLRR
jgi:hypothetical protein